MWCFILFWYVFDFTHCFVWIVYLKQNRLNILYRLFKLFNWSAEEKYIVFNLHRYLTTVARDTICSMEQSLIVSMLCIFSPKTTNNYLDTGNDMREILLHIYWASTKLIWFLNSFSSKQTYDRGRDRGSYRISSDMSCNIICNCPLSQFLN